jgi:hypothetical protein
MLKKDKLCILCGTFFKKIGIKKARRLRRAGGFVFRFTLFVNNYDSPNIIN